LTVDEADEPFANVYSAAVSIQNLLPAVSQRLLICAVAGAATVGALFVDIVAYETFLFLLGSFFVPLFGVLAADFLLGAASAVAVRWSGIAAWAAGFALYQRIQPTGPRGGGSCSRTSRGRRGNDRARCRRLPSPSSCTQAYAPRMRRFGVVGLVTLDRVDGGLPRLGACRVTARALRLGAGRRRDVARRRGSTG
jgi:hypothetical protein